MRRWRRKKHEYEEEKEEEEGIRKVRRRYTYFCGKKRRYSFSLKQSTSTEAYLK